MQELARELQRAHELAMLMRAETRIARIEGLVDINDSITNWKDRSTIPPLTAINCAPMALSKGGRRSATAT